VVDRNNHRARLAAVIAAASLAVGCGAHTPTATHGNVAPNGSVVAGLASSVPPATPPMSPLDNSPDPTAVAGADAAAQYAAAVKVLAQRGFVLADGVDSRGWHADRTLNELVGILSTSGDGAAQRVFFFVNGRYIGNDTSDYSERLSAYSRSDNIVTVTYGLFRPKDPTCCNSGGSKIVHFQWNGQNLVAQEPIPVSAENAPLSRR